MDLITIIYTFFFCFIKIYRFTLARRYNVITRLNTIGRIHPSRTSTYTGGFWGNYQKKKWQDYSLITRTLFVLIYGTSHFKMIGMCHVLLSCQQNFNFFFRCWFAAIRLYIVLAAIHYFINRNIVLTPW